MKRAVLVVGTLVALVAAAFGLRALRAGDDDAAATAEEQPHVLVCATEMAEACTQLADASVEVRVEAPGDTAARLRDGGPLGGDAWLAPRPWVELVQARAAAAGRADPLGVVSDTLARAALVVIVRSDRRATLETACGGQIDWLCIARQAGLSWGSIGGSDAWGTVRIGVDDPTRTTGGLVALAQLARTFVHRDVFDERDLETSRSTITSVLASLRRATDKSALDTMLDDGDSLALTLALESNTRVAIASPKASGQLELAELEPATGADAVLATTAGHETPVDHERVRRALTATGWHFADKTGSGVPSAATLEALLALWRATPPTAG